MKTAVQKLDHLKSKILPVLEKYHVQKAGVFGSYAKGDQKQDSDVDLLIDVKGKFSMFDLVGLKLELEKCVGKKIDLQTYNGINHHLRKSILEDEVRILNNSNS